MKQKYFQFNTLKELFDKACSHYSYAPCSRFLDGSQHLTYGEFKSKVQDVCSILSRYGIRSEDRVAILAENMPNWTVAFFSAVAFSRVAVPILPTSSVQDVKNILAHSETKALFVSVKQNPKAIRSFSSMNVVIQLDDFSIIHMRPKIRTIGALRVPEPRSLATIIYTSGTTGQPKGAMLSHRNLCHNILEAIHATAAVKGDRWLSILPMGHSYEMAFGMLFPIFVGGEVYYIKGTPTPAILLPAIKSVRPMLMMSVPLIIEKVYKSVLRRIDRTPYLSFLKEHFPYLLYTIVGFQLRKSMGGKLKFFGIGGAKLNPEVEAFLLKTRFPYAIGYGLTETAPLVCNACVGKTKVGSMGVPAYGVSVMLDNVNPNTGEGEILVKGPNVMMGYYKDPERTAQVLSLDGWFRTGDLAIKDKDGNYYIRGRLNSVIIGATGENIYPEDIEEVINSHPGVIESLVIQRSPSLVAMVLPEAEQADSLATLKEDLISYVNERVSRYSAISRVIFVTEPFIKTPTQKIIRHIYQ